MRYIYLTLSLLILVAFLFCSNIVVAQDPYDAITAVPEFKIGIVTDGSYESMPGVVDLFKNEIIQMGVGEFSVSFPKEYTLQADSTREDVNRKLQSLLAAPDVDLVLALGFIGSTEAIRQTNLAKPVIAPFIFDATWQKAPRKDAGSGVHNLYYIDLDVKIDQEVIDFRKLVPFENLGLLIDERDIQGVPIYKKLASYIANEHSIEVSLIPVGKNVEEALAAIPEDIKAVLVGALWQLTPEQLSQLAQGLIDRKIASFATAGYEYVERGFFTTKIPKNAIQQLARQVAINVQEIFFGEDAAKLPNYFSQSDKLAINMATARAINVYPSLEYMTGAKLLNEQREDIDRRLTLSRVVDEALEANLDLIIAEREVNAGTHSVDEAKSRLLPQLFAGTGGVLIDDDRAALGGGMSPEQTFSGSLQAVMQIYSESSWAGYTAEKFLQQGRESDRDRVELDIIFEASVAYLNALRQETIEKIQKENMQLTQANLERAQIRLSTGVAGPDEVYRWETQFARDRQVVLRAESSTRDTKQTINRILHRPLLEDFVTEENASTTDPLNLAGNMLFYQLIHNPLYFQYFNTFALERGKQLSPELKVFDAAIAAQERLLTQAKREFWVPTVQVEGDLSHLFADGGEGTRNEELTGLDDTDWQVGIYATIPLYEGGRRSSSVNRNKELLSQLKTERMATEERIGEQILKALNNNRASFPSINLSRDAAYSASRNLKLVTDSYVEGIKSVIDLLDAQNQALNAELDAANAVYNFLIDFMGLQRSVGIFITFMPEENQKNWRDEVKAYLESHGG